MWIDACKNDFKEIWWNLQWTSEIYFINFGMIASNSLLSSNEERYLSTNEEAS